MEQRRFRNSSFKVIYVCIKILSAEQNMNFYICGEVLEHFFNPWPYWNPTKKVSVKYWVKNPIVHKIDLFRHWRSEPFWLLQILCLWTILRQQLKLMIHMYISVYCKSSHLMKFETNYIFGLHFILWILYVRYEFRTFCSGIHCILFMCKHN
jgi:hypothetical protein